jgi:rRNA-processing protein FCF1|tara:strand:+ start:339 stop:704 length:366 start_codon:yes stop_codon:yes gene_type:complete
MKTVLVDTNIVLWTFSGGGDFIEAINEAAPGFEIAVPECVITELEKLGTNEAKAALAYCENVKTIDIGTGYADEMLINASKKGYIIATNDKELLEKLMKRKSNALRIKGKNRLMVTGSELI